MIARLFGLYRKSPFWLRNLIARGTWPLRLALLPFRTIKIGGYRMTLDFRDNASFKYYTDRERYEQAEQTAFLRAIVHNPGSYVLDIGANYGPFTLAAGQLQRLGVIERIFAFEPDRRPYQALCDSVRRNKLENLISVCQAIVSDRSGQETLFVNARSSADNRTHQVTSAPIRVRATYEVPSITIDAALRQAGVPAKSRFIIKMDIQGNEAVAFRGMRETLAQAEGYVLFFEHFPYLLRSAGTDPKQYAEFFRTLGADAFYEVHDQVTRLDGVHGLLAAFDDIERRDETCIEGPGSDFIIAKGMHLPFLEAAAQASSPSTRAA
jgi:FkbM family methyltransferase